MFAHLISPMRLPFGERTPPGSAAKPSELIHEHLTSRAEAGAAEEVKTNPLLAMLGVPTLHHLYQRVLCKDNTVAMNTHVTMDEWNKLGWMEVGSVPEATIRSCRAYMDKCNMREAKVSCIAVAQCTHPV